MLLSEAKRILKKNGYKLINEERYSLEMDDSDVADHSEVVRDKYQELLSSFIKSKLGNDGYRKLGIMISSAFSYTSRNRTYGFQFDHWFAMGKIKIQSFGEDVIIAFDIDDEKLVIDGFCYYDDNEEKQLYKGEDAAEKLIEYLKSKLDSNED